jgi:hypothetical protein
MGCAAGCKRIFSGLEYEVKSADAETVVVSMRAPWRTSDAAPRHHGREEPRGGAAARGRHLADAHEETSRWLRLAYAITYYLGRGPHYSGPDRPAARHSERVLHEPEPDRGIFRAKEGRQVEIPRPAKKRCGWRPCLTCRRRRTSRRRRRSSRRRRWRRSRTRQSGACRSVVSLLHRYAQCTARVGRLGRPFSMPLRRVNGSTGQRPYQTSTISGSTPVDPGPTSSGCCSCGRASAAPSEKYLSEHFLKYQSSKQLFLPG